MYTVSVQYFYRTTLCISAVFAVAWSAVRPSRWCIVSRRLKISSNFFLGPVGPSFWFSDLGADAQFQGEPLYARVCKIHGGGKNLRFSPEITVYLGNGTRQAHGCYRTPTGSHRRSIKWYHFRWSWVTPNSGFKVNIYLQVQYLKRDKFTTEH